MDRPPIGLSLLKTLPLNKSLADARFHKGEVKLASVADGLVPFLGSGEEEAMDISMSFERLIILVFGQKDGYQTAGQFANPETRNNWLRKAFKHFLKQIDGIDTTSRHKQMLMRDMQSAVDGLSKSHDPRWELLFPLISACARFLGHDYNGARVNTPSYWQSSDQKLTESIFEKTEDKLEKVKKDAITIRAKMCADLHAKKIDTFTIGLALNTSEYHVKKMIREGRTRK